jgi:2-methylcitrate dehydratase PrpD
MADAKYSVPFMVAFTLARGAPSLEGLADGVLDDPEILGIAARTDVRETFPDSAGCPRARVTVETASRSASSEVGSLKPMVDDEIRERPAPGGRLAAAIVAGFVQLALSRRDVGP